MKTPPFLRFALFLFLSVAAAFAQSGTLQFSAPVFTISEAGPIVSTNANGVRFLNPTMTVTRTGGSTGEVSVDYCVYVDETANNAKEYNYVAYGNVNANYVIVDNTRAWVSAGTLTWADGDTAPKTLAFGYNILNNPTQYTLCAASAIQGTITYSARLTTVIGGASLGTNATAKLEVTDAEAPAAGVLNLTSRRFYGADGGSAVISVRRDGGTTGSVSVNYATSSTLPAVGLYQAAIGAGVAGTHYTATTGTLTWADGDSSVKTFTVSLPATGNANGALNVAINLSSPTNSSVLGTVPSALLTIQNKASTVYDINDNVDGDSTYRVSLPPGTDPIRGILFWFPGSGGDDRHFTTDPNFRKIADQWRFAVASPRYNYDSAPNRTEFPQPKLAFFFNRLSQIAKTTGRPEIINAPFVLSGMSAGSYSTSRSLGVWPERTIAAVGQQGWTLPPRDIFGAYLSNFVFNSLSREIPAINLGGQLEGTQSPPSSIFPAMNAYRRSFGLTRSAVAMCWGRGHTFSNTGAAYNSVALYWLDQVMSAGRYLPGQAPTSTTAPVLGSLPIANGWWGARNSTNTKGTSNFYELPGGSSRFLAIAPDSTYVGVKDVNDALVDSWLPTESAARAYRAFVSLPTISFSAPAQFTSGLTGVPVALAINENGFGSGLTKVEFYEDNTKIGEDTTSPYTLSWTPATAGARSLTAIASDGTGPKYTAFTLFLASDPVAPTITAGQSNNGVINLPFSYQLAAGGPPTSYAFVSGTLPAGVTLNTTTGLLSGTPTVSGTFTPAFTATNSLGTSAAVSVTLNIAATAGVIIQESFAYTIGANAPDPDAGLNAGAGLPATNVGGNPPGTSTGLRGDWGITTDVVAGLSYTQGTKSLTTTGGAARINNATWGGNPFIYRFMTTDPFLAQRIGASNNGSLGVDGSSLFISFLASTSSATADAFRFSFRYDGSANFYVSNTATGWSLNGTTATNASLALNTPTLIVLRFDFAAGATDSVSMWVNPALGSALGSANATVSALNFPGLNNFTTRPSVANAMTLDELRVGTSLAAVTPFTEPAAPLAPVISSSLTQAGITYTALSYTITGSNSPTSYNATPLPAGLSINTSTGVISGTPTTAGTTNTTISATNAGGTGSATLVFTVSAPSATTYYVSPTGSDANAGTSAGTAWQTLAQVNGRTFVPGDVISFEGGQTFTGTLNVTSSGAAGNPITYTSYGTGRATISSGTTGGLTSSKSHIAITNLNFVGAGYNVANTSIGGLDFTVEADAQVQNIRLHQLNVSGYGRHGIRFNWRAHADGITKYGYSDVQVTFVKSHDNKDTGLVANKSTASSAAYTHSNFLIQDSWFYQNRGWATVKNSGNGLVLGDVDGALIDRCIAFENGKECTATDGGPVGIWSWSSNNVIIQYSESYNNGCAGSWDGGGFDIDGGNTNSIIQYCYSHGNEGPGYLVANYAGGTRAMRNNVVRYNISVNDATRGADRNQGAISVWQAYGNAASSFQDTYIYGNTVYQSVGPDTVRTTDSATTNTRIFNNVFIAANGKAVATIKQTSGVTMQGNLYWGSGGAFSVNWGGADVASLAAFQALGQEKNGATLLGRHADPLVQALGAQPTFNDPAAMAAWTAYQLSAASPAIDAGVSVSALIGTSTIAGSGPAIAHPGTRDFFGNAVPQGAAHDIGAQEGAPAAPVITAGQSAAGAQGVAFSYQLLANGSPTAFALASGSLPSGVTLNTATGLLSGTPASIGSFTPAFTATNAAGTSLAVSIPLTVRDPLLARWRFDNSLAASPVTYDATAVGTVSYVVGQLGSHALNLPGTTGSYVTAPFVLNPSLTDFTAAVWVYPNGIDQCILQQEDGVGTGRGWLYCASTNRLYSKLGNLEVASTGTLPTGQWTHVAVVKAGGTVTLYLNGVADGTGARTVESSTGNLRIGVNKAGAANWNGRLDDLRIYDAALTAASIASLYLYAEPTALASFRTAAGLAADGSQDLLTPAGDGVSNLLKYAFNMIGSGPGQAPTLATPNASSLTFASSAGLPFLALGSSAPDTGKLQLTYLRRKASASPAPGVSYAVQFSDDLVTWAANPSATESATSIDATFERVTVTDSVASPAKRFARVRVAAP